MGNIQSMLTCRTQTGMESDPKMAQFQVYWEILHVSIVALHTFHEFCKYHS